MKTGPQVAIAAECRVSTGNTLSKRARSESKDQELSDASKAAEEVVDGLVVAQIRAEIATEQCRQVVAAAVQYEEGCTESPGLPACPTPPLQEPVGRDCKRRRVCFSLDDPECSRNVVSESD